ncbi:MAG: phage major capsid protein [bacterium]|nr:phage major capsid protein [bacterium]
MAVPNIGDLVTTTLRHRSAAIADNVSNNNALLMRLKKKKRMSTVEGGTEILEALDFADNETYKRYTGYEVLDISPQMVLDSARYTWKQVAIVVSISGSEEFMNSGREEIHNLLSARIKNAERSAANGMSADVYSNGTASGGKQITGIQAAVSTSPSTGTYGGINPASQDWWRNIASSPTGAPDKATMKKRLQDVWVQLVRGQDMTDLVVMDNAYYALYWDGLTDFQRYGNTEKSAGAGFGSALKFNTADVVLDGGVGGDMPANRAYFLNTDFMALKAHKDRNMVPLGPDRFAVNQDAMIKIIGWAGALCLSNRRLQGVLTHS